MLNFDSSVFLGFIVGTFQSQSVLLPNPSVRSSSQGLASLTISGVISSRRAFCIRLPSISGGSTTLQLTYLSLCISIVSVRVRYFQFVSPSLWLRDPPCRRCLLLSVSVLSMYFFGFYGYFGYVLSDFNYFLFRYCHYQNIGIEYQKMPSIRRGENY